MPTPQASHDTVARTAEFEVTMQPRGAWSLAIVRGRFNDELLNILQRQVFLQLKPLAIDASALSGLSMALARAIFYHSQALRAQGQALALINPPDSLRGFFKLLGTSRIPMLLSESQLTPKPADIDQAADKLEKELAQVRRELESNQLWQMVDREFCWLCPFCGLMRDDVRLASRVSVPQPAVEKVWRHIQFQCRSYVPLNPRFKPKAELEAKIREANQVKLSANAKQVEALQTQVTKLEEKAQWATNIAKGVKIAASRQRKLLPTKAPTVAGCEIAYSYRPAEEVSGDFFDFVEMDGGRVGFVIGDVSGHGIEAGILMGMTKKVLNIRLSEMGDPVAAVKKTNADIVRDMDRSSFVTVSAVVFDPAVRTLTSARAGHNPPLLWSPSRKKLHKFEAGGLMIGMAQPGLFDAQLAAETMDVVPGDLLLLYTDGIEEGKNPAGEEFGLDRMVPVLQAEAGKPPAYLLGSLFYEFDRFSGGVVQEDDLTALCILFR
jgi:serine phosphatase RsbU (regulator of sigma subunit)/anti-anti-sigma regulatory factor